MTQFVSTKRQFIKNQETLKEILLQIQPKFVEDEDSITKDDKLHTEDDVEIIEQDVESFIVESEDEIQPQTEDVKQEIIETEPYVIHEILPEFAIGQFSIVDNANNSEMEVTEDIADNGASYEIIGVEIDDHESQSEYTVEEISPELMLPFPCQICPRTFENPQTLEEHLHQHVNRFSCGTYIRESQNLDLQISLSIFIRCMWVPIGSKRNDDEASADSSVPRLRDLNTATVGEK